METSLMTLVLVILLLAANGFFVAAEFALVKAKSFRIESLADGGSETAQLTLHIQHNLEPYLAACQLGITMASLGLGWIGEPAVAVLLEPVFLSMGMSTTHIHTVSFIIGFLLFSSLHIVIGEQLPKTLAIRKAEPVSQWITYPLHWFYLLAYPLNILLNGATSMILRLFTVEQATHSDVLSDDEIKGLISVSSEHGELAKGKADMLYNLFAFGERSVREIMVSRGEIDVLDLNAPAEENLKKMIATKHSRFPLVAGELDEIRGFVLVKDLYNAMLAGQPEPWKDLAKFAREGIVVPESIAINRLFEMMQKKQTHLVFVVDEYGGFTGILTMEDLIEEIVGEIADEFDEVMSIYPVTGTNGRWEAHGLAPLSDVEKITGFRPQDRVDASTLSGLFMDRLGRMPQSGDELEESDYQLTALRVIKHHVEKVVIEKLYMDSQIAEDTVEHDYIIDGDE